MKRRAAASGAAFKKGNKKHGNVKLTCAMFMCLRNTAYAGAMSFTPGAEKNKAIAKAFFNRLPMHIVEVHSARHAPYRLLLSVSNWVLPFNIMIYIAWLHEALVYYFLIAFRLDYA